MNRCRCRCRCWLNQNKLKAHCKLIITNHSQPKQQYHPIQSYRYKQWRSHPRKLHPRHQPIHMAQSGLVMDLLSRRSQKIPPTLTQSNLSKREFLVSLFILVQGLIKYAAIFGHLKTTTNSMRRLRI